MYVLVVHVWSNESQLSREAAGCRIVSSGRIVAAKWFWAYFVIYIRPVVAREICSQSTQERNLLLTYDQKLFWVQLSQLPIIYLCGYLGLPRGADETSLTIGSYWPDPKLWTNGWACYIACRKLQLLHKAKKAAARMPAPHVHPHHHVQ